MTESRNGRSRLERKRQEAMTQAEREQTTPLEDWRRRDEMGASGPETRPSGERFIDHQSSGPVKQKKTKKRTLPSLPSFRLRKRSASVKQRPRQAEKQQSGRDSGRRGTERPKRKWRGKMFGLLLLLLAAIVLFTSQPFTFMMIGSDARPGESLRGSRADSLSTMQFVPLSRTIQLTSIPRDTYTPIPCEDGQKDKITHSFAYGGEDCSEGAAETLLDTEVDSKIVISFDSFIGLIDTIGGIDLVSTGTFSEQDASGKANQYSFQKGKEYHMDGAMALAYSRHRKTDTDGARANRQSEIIEATAKELLKPTGWTSIPAAHRYMKEEMNLEISVRQMATAALSLALLSEREHLEIKGADDYIGGVYYYVPNEPTLKEVRANLDTTFYGTLKNQ
ncbi:LCP family protein [Exiguobacterium flavidum]|uniref:LCP family protein n=1 Tax=Exiguobacterium flavidum TaxID=2184695 RepID=UPI000DF7CDDE|nr:LCP family protein [Exiguobacterium flavidum]